MGIAAYNRGNKLITRQIEADRRPVEFEKMDMLNALPKYPKAPTPFGPVIFVFSHGVWWAECPVTGFGYCYPALTNAVRSWNVTITEYNNGTWRAVPNPTETQTKIPHQGHITA